MGFLVPRGGLRDLTLAYVELLDAVLPLVANPVEPELLRLQLFPARRERSLPLGQLRGRFGAPRTLDAELLQRLLRSLAFAHVRAGALAQLLLARLERRSLFSEEAAALRELPLASVDPR